MGWWGKGGDVEVLGSGSTVRRLASCFFPFLYTFQVGMGFVRTLPLHTADVFPGFLSHPSIIPAFPPHSHGVLHLLSSSIASASASPPPREGLYKSLCFVVHCLIITPYHTIAYMHLVWATKNRVTEALLDR